MASKDTNLFFSIGSQRCSAARLQRRGGSLELTGLASRELPADNVSEAMRTSQVIAIVDELAETLGARKGEPVRVALSAQNIYTKWVPVPVLAGRSGREVIEMEARQAVPFPLESVCWGFWQGRDGGELADEALIAAVRKEHLAQITDAVDQAGLTMGAIELSPFALANAFRFNYPDETESVLLLDLGARGTSLIFLEGGKTYLRTAAVGGFNLTAQISKEFGLDSAGSEHLKLERGVVGLGTVNVADDPEQEALSKVLRNGMTRLHAEITRTLSVWRSQQGGSPPTKIYLSGGGAALPYGLEFLQEKIDIPIEYFDCLRNVPFGGSVTEEQRMNSGYLVGDLVGAALGEFELTGDKLEILPDSVAAREDFRKRQPFLFAALALLFLGFAALVGANLFKKARFKGAVADNQGPVGQMRAASEQINDHMQGSGTEPRLEAEDGHLQLEALADSYARAIEMRQFWVSLFDDFNSRFDSDVVWLTQWETQKRFLGPDGKVVIDDLGNEQTTVDQGAPGSLQAITHVNLTGLYRGPRGQQTVFDEYNDLSDSENPSPWFKFVDREGEKIEITDIDLYDPLVSYGAPFEVRLPLARPIPVEPGTTVPSPQAAE